MLLTAMGPDQRLRMNKSVILTLKAHSKDRELSDGVVAVSSAKWGIFDPNLWLGDHADEIGHNLDQPLGEPEADTLQRYEQMVMRF